MPRAVCWLLCVADGTHHSSICIYAFASWYHGWYPGVKCLEPASDRLLCIGICYKSLEGLVLLQGPKQMEISGPQTFHFTWESAVCSAAGSPCLPFECILHAVLWTCLSVLVFSNRLYFMHTSSWVVLLVFVGGAENKRRTVLFRFPGTLPLATGAP